MISLDKKYRTRDGRPAHVICVNKLGPYPIVALVPYTVSDAEDEDVCTFTADGKFWRQGIEDERDLFEIREFYEFKIDDPVMVRYNENSPWVRRYFAGVDEGGKAQTWINGMTSWTAVSHTKDCRKTTWDHCRKPLPEEM